MNHTRYVECVKHVKGPPRRALSNRLERVLHLNREVSAHSAIERARRGLEQKREPRDRHYKEVLSGERERESVCVCV